eukprot:6546119-Prorocentrum_lima.AAC.1
MNKLDKRMCRPMARRTWSGEGWRRGTPVTSRCTHSRGMSTKSVGAMLSAAGAASHMRKASNDGGCAS